MPAKRWSEKERTRQYDTKDCVLRRLFHCMEMVNVYGLNVEVRIRRLGHVVLPELEMQYPKVVVWKMEWRQSS